MSKYKNISDLVNRILVTEPDHALPLVREFCMRGIDANGGISPRGTIGRAAPLRLPAGEIEEQKLLNKIDEFSGEVKHRLIGGLAMWGGPLSARTFSRKLIASPDAEAAVYFTRALGKLGGHDSVVGLLVAIGHTDFGISQTAIHEFNELTVGGSEDFSQPVVPSSGELMAIHESVDWLKLLDWHVKPVGSPHLVAKAFAKWARVSRCFTQYYTFAPPAMQGLEPWVERIMFEMPYKEEVERNAISHTVGFFSHSFDKLINWMTPKTAPLLDCVGVDKYAMIRTVASCISIQNRRVVPSLHCLKERLENDQGSADQVFLVLRNETFLNAAEDVSPSLVAREIELASSN